jgi:hypothetical protein
MRIHAAVSCESFAVRGLSAFLTTSFQSRCLLREFRLSALNGRNLRVIHPVDFHLLEAEQQKISAFVVASVRPAPPKNSPLLSFSSPSRPEGRTFWPRSIPVKLFGSNPKEDVPPAAELFGPQKPLFESPVGSILAPRNLPEFVQGRQALLDWSEPSNLTTPGLRPIFGPVQSSDQPIRWIQFRVFGSIEPPKRRCTGNSPRF